MAADLTILAVDERRGTIEPTQRLAFALAAAELVDLAKAKRIEASLDTRLTVTESLGTGDAVLDARLEELASCDAGVPIEEFVAAYEPERFTRQIAALFDSGELTGRAVTMKLGDEPVYTGLRAPERRRALTRKLADNQTWEDDLVLEAFGALAHIGGLSWTIPGFSRRAARRRLADLAGWFGDTWRYLPGCQRELALGRDDLAPGQVHPADEEPWRLAVLFAVEEAGRRVNGLPKPPRGVQNAALLDWAYDHGI